MLKLRKPSLAVIAACVLFLFTSCSSEEPPPRSRDEIFRARMQLPTVYLTAETNQRVTDTAERGVFVHEDTGEICWPALACGAPECPGRTSDGEPFLFIAPDPCLFVKDDGEIGYDPSRESTAANPAGGCPQCLKNRDLASETDEVRQRYAGYVKPYVLPETAKAQKELDEENRRRLEAFEKRRARQAPEG